MRHADSGAAGHHTDLLGHVMGDAYARVGKGDDATKALTQAAQLDPPASLVFCGDDEGAKRQGLPWGADQKDRHRR